jgi:hypothetical protein
VWNEGLELCTCAEAFARPRLSSRCTSFLERGVSWEEERMVE